jgi:hypothetical protein
MWYVGSKPESERAATDILKECTDYKLLDKNIVSSAFMEAAAKLNYE